MKMKTLRYRVKFITPAFLGNAFQKGQWRVPPFKALLRQWWRVAYAHEVGYKWKELHNIEARIFGAASDDGKGGTGKSRVRLRLEKWDSGNSKVITSTKNRFVCHPEVDLSHLRSEVKRNFYCSEHKKYHLVDSLLYLGYGPITTRGLANPPAVFGAINMAISYGSPLNDEAKKLFSAFLRAIYLCNCFGTIGGRSRNGWGSFVLSPVDSTEKISEFPSSKDEFEKEYGSILRPLDKCLTLDWPHAIGMDKKGPLVWKTEPKNSWEEVMKDLAEIKIAFRTVLPFTGSNMAEDRHILAYPVTRHNVLGNNDRLANQIRFKIMKTGNKYHGLIYHLPAKCPLKGVGHISEIGVWQKVHNQLDARSGRFV